MPQARRVSGPPHHAFFGYYDKCPWDRTQRYLLGHRADPAADPARSAVEVGRFDLQDDGRFIPFGETRAWNWQQGSMLQWLESRPAEQILFNRATEAGYETVLCDVERDSGTTFPRPLAAASPLGDFILSYDYGRLARIHPAIGYFFHPFEGPLEERPENAGVVRVDLETGQEQLILSYADAAREQPLPSMEGAVHWFSHAAVNPGGTRVLFLHRWSRAVEDENRWLHRLITCDPDGGNLAILQTSEQPPLAPGDSDAWTYEYEKNPNQISHPVWVGDRHVLAWSARGGLRGYHLYAERTGGVERIGTGTLTENGHFTVSPDGSWLVSDTYPDPGSDTRRLFLYRLSDERIVPLGDFYADPNLSKDARCDLHPRWSRDGRAVCIDSVHERARQIYTIDVSDVVV